MNNKLKNILFGLFLFFQSESISAQTLSSDGPHITSLKQVFKNIDILRDKDKSFYIPLLILASLICAYYFIFIAFPDWKKKKVKNLHFIVFNVLQFILIPWAFIIKGRWEFLALGFGILLVLIGISYYLSKIKFKKINHLDIAILLSHLGMILFNVLNVLYLACDCEVYKEFLTKYYLMSTAVFTVAMFLVLVVFDYLLYKIQRKVDIFKDKEYKYPFTTSFMITVIINMYFLMHMLLY